jgi:hypothetical protein
MYGGEGAAGYHMYGGEGAAGYHMDLVQIMVI